MSFINYLGGLKKEYHHIKTNAEENPGYEPAMVILHPGKKGKSFIIPIDCFWKYVNPMDILDALPMDLI